MSLVNVQATNVTFVAGATLAVNTTQYADNDLVGELITIPSPASRGKGCLLQSVVLHDLDSQSAALEMYVFAKNPGNTTFTNNGALDVNDADLPDIQGYVAIGASDYVALADNSIAFVKGLAIPLQSIDGSLYIAFRSNGATPTYTASGLSAAFGFIVDG